MSGKDHLVEKINEYKKSLNAVILAHNYQIPEVQDVADFKGDSLELSRKAQNVEADVIVFCGVHFMAETAALLSPNKTVLLPDLRAGCPMADMVTPEDVLALRRAHPSAVVMCYVNSTAAVKAVSDVCCTSSNAVDIAQRIPEDREIIFVPDKYLAEYVERVTGRKMITHPGFCPTHVRILPEHIVAARDKYPGAPVIVHPECRGDVCEAADLVLSTGGMCQFAKNTDADTVIVGTETGLLYRMEQENPDKKFVDLLRRAICPNMKMTNLEKVMWALEERKHVITVTGDVAKPALASILAMFEKGPIQGRGPVDA